MTRMKMFALALGVWGLGAASAAALTIDLSRAPTPRVPLVDTTPVHVEAPQVVRHLDTQSPVLTLAPITIVGRRLVQPPGVTAPQKPEPRSDVTRMNCTDWRDLQMGSGRVQSCE